MASFKMGQGHDITLVITVRGRDPWSKTGGRFVRELLSRHGYHLVRDLEQVIAGELKPADWRACEVGYRVFEEHNPNRR